MIGSRLVQTPANLVPELKLIEPLAPHWQRRFIAAVEALHQGLYQGESVSWEQIADQCAISAGHFHRMFSLVFNETPGQYLARCRLQWAVLLLVDDHTLRVTDIALQCGYSSSQALAKALQRGLGLSARQIRSICPVENRVEYDTLLQRLAHPKENSAGVEADLARELRFQRLSRPAMLLHTETLSSPGLLAIERWWNNKTSPATVMVMTQAVDQLDKPVSQQRIQLGYEVDDMGRANQIVAAGDWLGCRALISSEVGYISVLDVLFKFLISQALELDESREVVEILHNPDVLLTEPSDISFLLPVKAI